MPHVFTLQKLSENKIFFFFKVEKNQSSTIETSEDNSPETKISSSESKSSLNKLKKSNDKTNEENEVTNTSLNETNSSNLKSEIMLVHEYAYRLKKSVTFEVSVDFLLLK